MAYKIQFRRDTAANWESVNPVLSEGEVGHDLTNGIFKLGDGVSNWQSLPEFDSETKAHTLDFHSDTSGFATADPSMDGAAAVGVSDKIAREDHVHPTDTSREPANANIQSHISSTDNPHTVTVAQIGAEPANANIQSHISSTENPHGVTTTQIGAEPANANIQSHISSTENPHSVSVSQIGAVAANTAIAGGTHTKITYDAKGLITAGENISASDVPALDASILATGVLDIARIPAAALERMVPVASQAARYALTTATVQLGDTVKQLDTGIMYVVIDTANLANAAGYAEYTAATAAAVPWSGVQSKPTTLSGYGITDATPSSHVGTTGAAHGAVTTSVNGFMSAADKTKLDGIADGAQVNVGTNIGTGTVTTTTVPLTSSTGTGTTLNAATASLAGVMSSADKTKLNGIATGATANTAYTSTPAAPTTTGSAGANAAYARGDHAHPSRIATSAPASPVNGDIWMV